MKIFATFVLLAACLTLSPSIRSHASKVTTGAPAQTAYNQLQHAETFALGGVGFAGKTSAQELAFRELAKDTKAELAFLALINDKTTTKVGQLYGLLGLKEKNSAQFKAQLPAFLADNSPVNQMSGCIIMTVKASEIAQHIKERPATQEKSNA